MILIILEAMLNVPLLAKNTREMKSGLQGAPSWYITLSPADNKHPISLYNADTQEEFTPVL